MDPLSIAAISIGGASLLTQLGFGVANSQKTTPKMPGATSAELLSQASTRQLANKLQTGQGMSDTAYNARMSGARDVQAAQAGQAAAAMRGTFNMPGVVADRLLREAFRKGETYMAKTQQELTLADIETNLSNLKAAVGAEGMALQASANVSEREQQAKEKNLRIQMMKEEALANTLFGVAKGTAGLMAVAGQLNDIGNKPQNLGKVEGTTVSASTPGVSQAKAQGILATKTNMQRPELAPEQQDYTDSVMKSWQNVKGNPNLTGYPSLKQNEDLLGYL